MRIKATEDATRALRLVSAAAICVGRCARTMRGCLGGHCLWSPSPLFAVAASLLVGFGTFPRHPIGRPDSVASTELAETGPLDTAVQRAATSSRHRSSGSRSTMPSTSPRSRCRSTTTDPTAPRFELFLARYNAIDQDRRIGTLLVNPGGPGFGGTDLAFFAAQIFDRKLLERFDIIGWDPRGTGESDPPIDCIDDYDPYFTESTSTPETDGRAPGARRHGPGLRRAVHRQEPRHHPVRRHQQQRP